MLLIIHNSFESKWLHLTKQAYNESMKLAETSFEN